MALIIHSVILCFVFVRNVLYLFIYFLAIFLQGCISPALKRNQSLKKRSAKSVSSNKKIVRTNSISSCEKRNICKNHLICFNDYTSSVTNRKYYTSGALHCNCNSVI